jgi:hypothetical protein
LLHEKVGCSTSRVKIRMNVLRKDWMNFMNAPAKYVATLQKVILHVVHNVVVVHDML